MNPLGIIKVQITLVFIFMVLNLYFTCGIVTDDCFFVWMKRNAKKILIIQEAVCVSS